MARVIYTDRKEKRPFPPRTCRKGLYDDDASFTIVLTQWSKRTGLGHGTVWRAGVTSSGSFAPQNGTLLSMCRGGCASQLRSHPLRGGGMAPPSPVSRRAMWTVSELFLARRFPGVAYHV